ncbi:MFS general substrate transporter [Jaminaea rosea]|uniref:MFS general substrate transporter n=1 Tax=Jaminaea rosea TaxID=1569628 RepID=A0A316UQF3_9BASI|nr:MFS general substrate transporter [Jaminaea rosea]PWN26103.1 MFS general substrate transporter [Jaminaea rosea]
MPLGRHAASNDHDDEDHPRPHDSDSPSSSYSDLDVDPTVALLRSESIPLRNMIRTPTLKRSHSSKRILPRDSDDEEGDAQRGNNSDSPSRARARRSFMSSRSHRSSIRNSRILSGADQASPEEAAAAASDDAAAEGGELTESPWMLAFDDRRSAKENKSLAVSAELDAMGMGRYQWFIFFLCGLGFFIDLLWAQAFGLILVPLKNEGFGAMDGNIGTLTTAFNVGLTVGAFSWGIGVDVVGRKWSFYLTCLIAGIFGVASGAGPSFTGLRILVAFVGFGVGGNIPIDCTITLEFLPTGRHYLLALLSVFQPIGTLAASGIAYGFVPRYSCGGGSAELMADQLAACTRSENAGWRYTLYTIGAITLFVFFVRFLVFKFRESPAYLINRGHDAEALQVLYEIAKVNKVERPRLDMDDFREIEQRCMEIQTGRSSDSDMASRLSGLTHDTAADKPMLTGTAEASDANADSDADKAAQAAKRAAPPSGGASGTAGGRRVSPRVSAKPAPSDEKIEEDETAWQTVSRTLGEMGAQLRGIHILFRDRVMARITILMWLTYMADFFGFTIAGTFLPQILADRGLQQGRALSETYRDYVIIYAPGILACLVGCALIEVPRVGRQWVMVISSALMGVSMFIYTIIDTEAGSVGLNAMEYFFQSLFNAVLYAVVPEFYPSAVRGTAAGITSTLGRIAGIVAPLAGDSLYGQYADISKDLAARYTLYLGGGVTLLCPIALALLPYDTRGRRSY